MNNVLKALILLPAVLFLSMGLRWLFAPAGVAPDFGLTLETGAGLSSQVGDMTGFFLTLSICMFVAVFSGRRIWYYPAIMLLGITAVARIVAWALHDAALAIDMIIPEVVIAAILVAASRRLPDKD